MSVDTHSYYNAMAEGYERHRHDGYHVFLDSEEVSCAKDFVRGASVLEIGCGTGLILSRIAPLARRVVGIDLSAPMLKKARARCPAVIQASAQALPFPDSCFDAVVAFKVLPHIENVRRAIEEMARVVKPGGYVIMEFYNRHSLRTLIKRVKPPSRIAEGIFDKDVYTRYDTIPEILSFMPVGLEVVRIHGIRIVLPAALLMSIPIIGTFWKRIERALSKGLLRRFGGFLVVVARRR